MAERTVTMTKKAVESFGFSIVGGAPSPVVVSKIKPGSPAASADLAVGDNILSINGESLAKASQFKAVSMVKQARESITLVVVKGNEPELSTSSPSTRRRVVEDAQRRATGDSQPASKLGATPAQPAQPAQSQAAAKAPAAKIPATASKPAASAPAPTGASASAGIDTSGLMAVVKRIEQAANNLGFSIGDTAAVGSLDAASLETIVSRLEKVLPNLESGDQLSALAAIITRIEKSADRLGAPPAASAGSGGNSLSALASAVTRITNITNILAPGSAGSSGESDGQDPPSVASFDEILGNELRDFLELSRAMGGDVAQQARSVETAFIAQRRFLAVAPQSRKPGPKVLPLLLEATSNAISDIQGFAEARRSSDQFNQISAVSSGIAGLGWVTIEKPCPYIKEMIGSAQFYSNRVLKEFKETDQSQVEWARAFVAVLNKLYDYVKFHHTTGLVWGSKVRSMTFWSNAISTTAPGQGDPEKWIYSTRYRMPVPK